MMRLRYPTVLLIAVFSSQLCGCAYLKNMVHPAPVETAKPAWTPAQLKKNQQQRERQQLMAEFSPSFLEQILHIGSSTEEIEDAAIQGLLHRNFPHGYADTIRGYESYSDNNPGSSWFSQYISGPIGISSQEFKFYPAVTMIKNALPIVQALLLFALYTFLGFGMVFSAYRIRFVVIASVAMFSLIFCDFIWHAVQWLDWHMIQVFYGADYRKPGMRLVNLFANTVGSQNSDFMNMIISAAYIGFPMFWVGFVSWMGYQISGAISTGMQSSANTAEAVGKTGGQIIENTAIQITDEIL